MLIAQHKNHKFIWATAAGEDAPRWPLLSSHNQKGSLPVPPGEPSLGHNTRHLADAEAASLRQRVQHKSSPFTPPLPTYLEGSEIFI